MVSDGDEPLRTEQVVYGVPLADQVRGTVVDDHLGWVAVAEEQDGRGARAIGAGTLYADEVTRPHFRQHYLLGDDVVRGAQRAGQVIATVGVRTVTGKRADGKVAL